MKNIVCAVLVCFLTIFACTDNSPDSKVEQKESKIEASKNISRRDRSITAPDSYSDLFFDSTLLEKFIKEKKLIDSIADRMRSFYNARNYQYAWFSSDGLTEQARAFWNLHDYVTTYDVDSSLKDKALQKKMDYLIAEDELSVNATDKSFLNTELMLTQHFIRYVLHNYAKGFVKRKEMERFIPRKKENVLQLADSLLNKKHKDDKYFEDVNPAYNALKMQLAKYVAIAKQGGWTPITAKKKVLKKGTTAPEVAAVKKRLQLTDDFHGSDSTQRFDDTLETSVKKFQSRHGYRPTGIVNDSLIKEMNVPVEKRIQQILMNMDRMRWLAIEPKGNLIVVNIPEFVLHLYEGNRKVFDMDVVVGKEGHNTTMFNGDLNQVVFSPYWNVPQDIVKKEILPAMEKNHNYLEKENMEITGEEDGVPVIRQQPGEKNAARSGGAATSEVLFDAAGLRGRVDMATFRLKDALARLADGSIDALVWSGGVPTPAIADLDDKLPLRMLDTGPLAAPMSRLAGYPYVVRQVPTGSYVPPGIRSIGVPDLLLCRHDIAADLVAAVVDVLASDAPQLVPPYVRGRRTSPSHDDPDWPHTAASRCHRRLPQAARLKPCSHQQRWRPLAITVTGFACGSQGAVVHESLDCAGKFGARKIFCSSPAVAAPTIRTRAARRRRFR